MDRNSGHSNNRTNSNYTPLRKPHNPQDMTPPSSQPMRSSRVLSPNAPEFVMPGRTNQNRDDPSIVSNAMKSNSIQDRLNVRHPHYPSHQDNMHSNPFANHHNNHQQHHHHHHHDNFNRVAPAHNRQNNTDNEISGNNMNLGNLMTNLPQTNNVPPPQQPSQQPQENTDAANEEAFAINYIQTIVKCLNDNPGSFDSIAARALSMFEGFGENHYVLSNAMEIIFNKSIDEQNFRYMGAKLYNLLDLIDLRKDSMFRNLLNLKLTYHQNEVLKYMQNEHFKVRGTTLFLAELYMQLRNDGTSIKDIGQNIVFSIQQLLQKITPENIKCICLTLKLAGYDLEKDCPTDINQIMMSLRNINSLDVSTSRILETVLNLQKCRWGRNIDSMENTQNFDTIRNTDEPVFYGPDGQILTEEENSFLESNLFYEENNDDDPYSDIELDPEMDAETELAYKDFLKNNVNKK